MCKKCGKLIPQKMKMCEECEAKEPSRHVAYNDTRRDRKAADFYVSREWRTIRPRIINVFNNVDIYALYVRREILTCEQVHHIIEIEDDWTQRLNPMNLIPLHASSHSIISALYKQSDAQKKETQIELRALLEYHFKDQGGYEKVLSAANLVAPHLIRGENSPRKIQK